MVLAPAFASGGTWTLLWAGAPLGSSLSRWTELSERPIAPPSVTGSKNLVAMASESLRQRP
jgi:hypothetical protein